MQANRTLIIAEAGVNHNGDMNLAKQLIDVAVDAGADIVKFQSFNADRLTTTTAEKAIYQIKTTGKQESQYEMLRRLELSIDMHKELIEYCSQRHIEFFSTGFDIDSVNLLIDLGQSHFKIPSGEITNLPYLRHIGQQGKEVVLSTGMSTLGDIEFAINALEQSGTNRNKITILHCTTEYPTPMNEVNLSAMQNIHKAFGVKIGYSDHTQGIEVAIAAAALGASVIEKHFTLDRTLPGPDHKASLEPNELKSMIQCVRNINVAMGDGIKRLTPSEMKNKDIARKSIVAGRAINKGEKFTEDNLTTKRPGTGISPINWDLIVGKIAARDYLTDELIEF